MKHDLACVTVHFFFKIKQLCEETNEEYFIYSKHDMGYCLENFHYLNDKDLYQSMIDTQKKILSRFSGVSIDDMYEISYKEYMENADTEQ